MEKMLNGLQQRLQSAELKGSLSVTSRHVTTLLRCILSALQGSDERQQAEAQLCQLEQELKAQQATEASVAKTGQLGTKEAEILRACVAKAGPSVFDSLDAAVKVPKEVIMHGATCTQ